MIQLCARQLCVRYRNTEVSRIQSLTLKGMYYFQNIFGMFLFSFSLLSSLGLSFSPWLGPSVPPSDLNLQFGLGIPTYQVMPSMAVVLGRRGGSGIQPLANS